MTITGAQGDLLVRRHDLDYTVTSNGDGGETHDSDGRRERPDRVHAVARSDRGRRRLYLPLSTARSMMRPAPIRSGSSSTVQAVDADGDKVNQTFTVNVQDDMPVLVGNVTNGTVSEGNLPPR